jgi:hypothetical protein
MRFRSNAFGGLIIYEAYLGAKNDEMVVCCKVATDGGVVRTSADAVPDKSVRAR